MSKKEEEEKIIGIDLGTIFSCVAIMRNKKVEIITDNTNGERIIPSMVCFKSKNECLIGIAARNNMIEFYKSTMFESKRLLGYKFNDKHVQNDIKNWPIKIIEDEKTKKPLYICEIENEEKKYFPEDVSSMILKYLKKFSEIYENKKIKNAVITVPARFNNLQRIATLNAAEKSGLNVIKIINEPTAAAIAYGLNNKNESNHEIKTLIFDLGGGTFDVSILKIINNDYYILASLGEEHLGGEDFNQRLMDYVINEIKKDDKFKNIDFYNKENDKAMKSLKRLRQKTEEIKIILSNENNANFFIDSLYSKDINILLTREKYEELCMDLFEKCFKIVDDALKLAKLKKEEIDDIILVGGSTRTPKIQEMIKNYFNGKEPLKIVNPDEVVAKGALLSAYLKNINIHDIMSKSIRIEIQKGVLDIIIPAGTLLPINGKSSKFTREFLLKKNKSEQTIKIYEGNSEIAEENQYLGKYAFYLKNLKNFKIKISMTIDHNAILNVIVLVNDGDIHEIAIPIKF